VQNHMPQPSYKDLRSFPVMGVSVHIADHYLSWLIEQIRNRQSCHVVTLNAEMTMQAQRNPELATTIQNAELVVPDGAGVVFYLMLYGLRVKRLPGIELAEALLRQMAASPDLGSVFFFGSAPGVAQKAAEAWQSRLPELSIAGSQHGFLTSETQHELEQRLQALQPQVIFVGLGVPRQEFWLAEHRHLCPNATWIGVGGSFDIWAGTKRRAPAWLRNHNLEWVYRLYQEPWRWRRMLALPEFAGRSLLHRLTDRPSAS
jgi:N-acetylglucosaminyldiphosphoundecaprenol N-acetyl-beta-D-mannosaminyltransferase